MEKAIRTTVNPLPASSRRSLAEAFVQTNCARCGCSVAVKDRAVVTVDGEVRVFHTGCSVDAITDIRHAQLKQRSAALPRRR